jgi:hypothetical protein
LRIKTLCIFFLAILGFELKTLHLLGRHSTAWAVPPILFALVESSSHFFALAGLDQDPPTYASHIGMTATMPSFLCWNKVLLTFCPGWPQTAILLISTSHVARTIGMSHKHLASMWPFETIKRYSKNEMYKAAASVIWHTVLWWTGFFKYIQG